MVNGSGRDIRAPRAGHRSAGHVGVVLALLVALCPAGGLASGQPDQTRSTREIPFADVKLLIEHNATAKDTGFQVFLDGEPWNALTIEDPNERPLLEIRGRGALRTLGLTELFFETNEPPNAEVPIEELLAQFPEGEYEFEGRSIEGAHLAGTATLSHSIPAGPRIVSPADGAVVDHRRTVVRWERVTESVTGAPVEVVGYEVIVVKPVDVPPPGFSKPSLSVHVSASTTSLTVPKEFLKPGTAYELEVLALERGGNQTISASSFRTR
jgi:hypothetical protein